MKTKLIIGAVVVAIILAVAYAVDSYDGQMFGGQNCNSGNCTDFDAVNTSAGYYVDDTQVIDGSGTWIGGITAAIKAVFDAGATFSYTNATSSSATTQTLITSDIADYTTVIFTPTVGATTLTLPATSTITAFVPNAGDWAEQVWVNGTTTAAATITFAAGTGIDLETASSTTSGAATSLAIPANTSAVLKYIRKANTDIIVQFLRFADGD